MTQEAKEQISPERVSWFAEYYKLHPDWGMFRLSTQTNYYSGVLQCDRSDPVISEVASWFNRLSVSQRRRLITRAEDQANSIVRSA